MGWRSTIDLAAAIAMIGASLSILWRAAESGTPPIDPVTRVPVPLPSKPLSLEGAALKGDLAAKIVLIEYADFQCPFCGRFSRDTLPTIEQNYVATGKVLLAFRHLPIRRHPFAQKAAEAAECARRQGKFWELHDANFAHQDALDEAALVQRARSIGLIRPVFAACLAGSATGEVQADAREARSLGITGTPTFFLGWGQAGQVEVAARISGAQPVSKFAAAIDALLKAAR